MLLNETEYNQAVQKLNEILDSGLEPSELDPKTKRNLDSLGDDICEYERRMNILE